jgi:hypothetical protein
MDNVKRFLEESPLALRMALPTHIVVHRLKLSPEEVGSIMESGALTPSGGEVCELEVGGQCIARGKIMRKRGEHYFKVLEMEKGDTV